MSQLMLPSVPVHVPVLPAEHCDPLKTGWRTAGEEHGRGLLLYRQCSASRNRWEECFDIKKRGGRGIKFINAQGACREIWSVPQVLGKLFVTSHDLLNGFPCIICQELTTASSSLLMT